MATMSPYYLFLTLFCLAILNPIGCYAQKNQERKLMFVLGDSLFDPGNNKYLNVTRKQPAAGTTWPYGMSYHNHSTGRLSDGLLVPDVIALFAGLNILPPYLQPKANFTDGANFASAGGAVLDSHNTEFMDLSTQLNNFKKLVSSMVKKSGEAETKKALNKAFFLISLGGNDYFGYNSKYPNATQIERKQFMHMVIGNLTLGIKELYGMGLRKLAFQNVGPLGCYPTVKSTYSTLNGSCVKRFMEHASMHNKALYNRLSKFQRELPGFKFGILDYYHALADRLDNPTKYGFKVGQVACLGSCDKAAKTVSVCKNPSEYVLFDCAHHTQRTNIQLAKMLWNGPPAFTGAYTAKQLFELP